MGKCYTFKGQRLVNGVFCIFQARGNTPHRETGREQDDMKQPGTLIQVRPCEGGSLAMSHGR